MILFLSDIYECSLERLSESQDSSAVSFQTNPSPQSGLSSWFESGSLDSTAIEYYRIVTDMMLGPAARFVNLDCNALRLSSHRGRRWDIARRHGEVEVEGLSLQAHGTAGRCEVWCLGIGARGKRLEADETSAGPTIPWNGSASVNIVIDGNTFTFQSGFYYEITIVTHRAIETFTIKA